MVFTVKSKIRGENNLELETRLVIIAVILIFVAFCLSLLYLACIAASKADRAMEKYWNDKKNNSYPISETKELERKISKDMTALTGRDIKDLGKYETIKIKYFDNELPKIEKIENGDWIDLRSAEDIVMDKGDFRIISLGIAMKLPEGYEAHVVPRSSTFKNFGIIQTNHCGVIDESYCGDEDVWKFPALAMRQTVIHKGDRICQFRIMQKMPPVRFEEAEKLEDPSRGGFGSTGVN